MYDSSFTTKTLAREVRKSDFTRPPLQSAPQELDSLIKRSFQKALAHFPDLPIIKTNVKNKTAYKPQQLEDDLVIRKINANLKILTGVKQSNRNLIVLNIIRLLEENVSYRVYRLDIQNFYESIDLEELIFKTNRDLGISRETVHLLKSFFNHFKRAGATGIPRGLPISATLAEYVMRDFDQRVSKVPDVQFFSRFVDDVIIITNGEETPKPFLRKLAKFLFKGLRFHNSTNKMSYNSVGNATKDDTGIYQFKFSFLGYEFQVFNPNKKKTARRIDVDLAPNKEKKIKTKILKAVISFLDNKDFDLLEDRIKLLTSNYLVFDVKRSVTRKSGIFYNYPQISSPEKSRLANLDSFFKKVVLSNSGALFSSFGKTLTKEQKKRLLKFSFVRGFKQKVIYDFPPDRLNKILECWSYV